MEILSSRILLHPSDLERSLRFYEQTLGLALYREWGCGPKRGVVFFLGGGLLEVSGSTVDPPCDAVRLFLQVRDLRAAWRRLTERGVVSSSSPKSSPLGPV
jgi:predicted enzyme related to lactoylglutathione lyase